MLSSLRIVLNIKKTNRNTYLKYTINEKTLLTFFINPRYRYYFKKYMQLVYIVLKNM